MQVFEARVELDHAVVNVGEQRGIGRRGEAFERDVRLVVRGQIFALALARRRRIVLRADRRRRQSSGKEKQQKEIHLKRGYINFRRVHRCHVDRNV